jgi:glutathione S-transferase
MQVLHRIAVRRAGGRRTAPVLRCPDGTVLADSAEIVSYADSHAPPPRRLYPQDISAAMDVRAFELEFDEVLGPEGRRWMYHELRGQRDLVIRYGTTGVPPWQQRSLPLSYPIMSRFIDRYLDVTPATAAWAEREVRRIFDGVWRQLSDGRDYLMGDEFTAADLTFAALAAPVLLPPEYGVPLPQPDELPAPMAAVVRDLRIHPAGAHAMRMYREERIPT